MNKKGESSFHCVGPVVILIFLTVPIASKHWPVFCNRSSAPSSSVAATTTLTTSTKWPLTVLSCKCLKLSAIGIESNV